MLNLVELTPEGPYALKGDVHENTPAAATFSPAPVAGVGVANTGWTTLGGAGGFTKVELLETGPVRGHLRLTRAGETWDLMWTASGAWFRWKAMRGFRFASISASPYLPFNRCLGGSEYNGPNGPGESTMRSGSIASISGRLMRSDRCTTQRPPAVSNPCTRFQV